MPDIDMDFCYEKRAEVLSYVAKKYGQDNVAQIITFGTMLARAVVRDVGRVLGYSYSEVDKIAKMIPVMVGQHITLEKAITMSPELSAVYNSDSGIKRLIDVAMQLEGLSRHASTHAAGVVISDKPLMDRIPLVRGAENEIVTGFDMESLEKTGLLKMDFLGLKTLTVIEETTKIIKRTQNKDAEISNIPLDDKHTFSLLAKSNTIGVFQLESRGMRDILRKLIPTKFEDLIAVLALYRPGPLGSGMVDDFIERKQGKKNITYLDKKLEPILKETYGIILYQEQTMQIASQLAGFDMARADLLRKAIGKKVPEIMEEQRNLFVEGCHKNHIPQRVATQIFDLIDYFSGYGFNKSHSTAYAMISYRTAYLKANFPVEFMAALLTSERTNTDKVVEYINEANRMGIKVLPPDINTSFANFTVTEDKNIRFGLLAIKNVGTAALDNIIEIRKQKKFESFFNFCDRTDSRVVNKKVMESLIKSGAMDGFGLKRAQMMSLLDKLLNKPVKKEDPSQFLLFKVAKKKEEIPEVEEWPLSQILGFEKSLLGIYVTSHPLYSYLNIIKHLKRREISSLYEEERYGETIICGIVEKARIITTRKGNERMAILKIEDETASVEVFVFPRLFEEAAADIKEKAILLIRGKLESKEKTPKILAEAIIPIEHIWKKIKGVNISIGKNKFPLNELKSIFLNNRGKTPVIFALKDSRLQPVKIKTADGFSLNLNEDILSKIGSLIGEENLSLTI
jgi:DNA polymerase-3 subunit alpha